MKMVQRRYSLFTLTLITLQFLLGQPEGVVGDSPFPAAQPCFDAATASAKCDTSDTSKFNACACTNTGGWLDLSAKCIGVSDKNELTAIYNSLSSNCAGSNTPIAYPLDKWLAAAGTSGSTTPAPVGSTTTVTTPGPTKVSTTVQTSAVVSTVTLAPTNGQTTPVISVLSFTPGRMTASTSVVTLIQSGTTNVVTLGNTQATGSTSPVASPGGSGSKLNTQSIIGIAVGVPCFLALMGVLLFLVMRRRKQEHHHSPSDMREYDSPVLGRGEGVAAAAKRPQSTATVLSEATSQPSYGQNAYPNPYPNSHPMDSGPQSNVRTDPYFRQPPLPQHMQGMRPAPYPPNPQFSAMDPRSGTVELQAQPVNSRHELPGYL